VEPQVCAVMDRVTLTRDFSLNLQTWELKHMSLIAREKSDYTPIPEGQYPAVISAVVDLGLQDCFGSVKPQILIRYEMPGLRSDHNGGSEPASKWQFYTRSLNNMANLRRDSERILGRGFSKKELDGGFDLFEMLGCACEVQIVHDHSTGSIRDKIVDVSKFKGPGEKPTSELGEIRYTRDENESWENLPEWVKEKIRNQVVVAADSDADAASASETSEFQEDELEDIPF